MLALSVAKALESRQSLQQTLSELGVSELDDTPIGIVLSGLELSSEGGVPITAEKSARGVVRFDEPLASLRRQRLISEAIGSTKISVPAVVYFSTLLSKEPKPYTLRYQEIANTLLEAEGSMFRVWLEDSFSQLYRGWDKSTCATATKAYSDHFRRLNDKTEILVSSRSGVEGVPQKFVDEQLKDFTLNDFKELLPFHLRSPELITALDIVHFCWNCYVVTTLPGIHLVGANTKRHFQVFRKISGGKLTVVLVPQMNE